MEYLPVTQRVAVVVVVSLSLTPEPPHDVNPKDTRVVSAVPPGNFMLHPFFRVRHMFFGGGGVFMG